MKIVIAPDSYKGTMTSKEVALLIESAAKDAMPDIKTLIVPISDGGEGLTEALLHNGGGERYSVSATMPNGGKTIAEYGVLENGSAVVEMAAASSVTLCPKPKDPLNASSYGTGEVIAEASKRCKTMLLGLGGSGCMDGGMGATAAMGVKYLDKYGREVSPNPLGMEKVRSLSLDDVDPRFFDIEYRLCVDVENELCGKNGAAHVFGSQKGANAQQIEFIDKSLYNLARVLEDFSGKKILGMPGFGAAGGFAMPFYALFNAVLQPGIELMLNCCNFDKTIEGADLVITGEGKTDAQTLSGKAPIGVARRAAKLSIPTIAISGDIELDLKSAQANGISALFSTNRRAVRYKDAKQTAKQDLYETALSVFSLLKTMRGFNQ